MNNFKYTIQWFSCHMEEKLLRNSYKGGWEECKNVYLLDRMDEEIAKLKDCIINGEPSALVVSEAADIANFAMMLADNYSKRKEAIENE